MRRPPAGGRRETRPLTASATLQAGESKRPAPVKRWARNTFAAMWVRDYRYLLLGNFASQVGQWLQVVALGWLAYDLTSSGAFLGAVGLARAAPSAVLTLPAGVLADRWDRRKLLVASQAVGLANALALAFLVGSGAAEPWHLLLTSFVGGIAQSLNMPARQSLAPELAGQEHLANAIALNAISFNTSRVIGPALAGILMSFWGVAACFAGQAVGFVWAMAWTLAITREAERPEAEPRSFWDSLWDGVVFVKKSETMLALLAVSAVPVALGQVYVQLMPVFAREVVGLDGSGLGLLMSAVGIGSLVGALATAALNQHPQKATIQLVAGVVFGGGIILFSLTHWVAISFWVLILVGGAQAIVQAVNQTLLNLITPNVYRGRMMSMYLMTWNLAPVVWLPAGWLSDVAGVPITLFVSGVLVIGSTIALAKRVKTRDQELVLELDEPIPV